MNGACCLQVAADTNTNYLFVTGRDATPVALNSLMARLPGEPLPTLSAASPAGQSDYANLLGGLLAGYDHTKAVMPMVHTITWSLPVQACCLISKESFDTLRW